MVFDLQTGTVKEQKEEVKRNETSPMTGNSVKSPLTSFAWKQRKHMPKMRLYVRQEKLILRSRKTEIKNVTRNSGGCLQKLENDVENMEEESCEANEILVPELTENVDLTDHMWFWKLVHRKHFREDIDDLYVSFLSMYFCGAVT